MDETEMRAYAEQNFDQKIEEAVEPVAEQYREDNSIESHLLRGLDAGQAVAEELHADAIDDFADEGSDYVKDNGGEIADGFQAWFDENFDPDYLYQMVEQQFNLHESELDAEAREMLRTDVIDQDEELSQLDSQKVETAIAQSDLDDVLDADYKQDAHGWADRYLPDWEDEIDEA